MKRQEILLFAGQKIYSMNFSDMKNETEIKMEIDKCITHIRSQKEGSVYTLTNLTNMHFNTTIKELFTDFVKGNKPYIKASAVIGLSVLARIVYNGLMRISGRTIRSFDNEETAKDWLVSQ